MRTYYRIYLLYATWSLIITVSFAYLAIMTPGWWTLAPALGAVLFAYKTYGFIRRALVARRYIGHPLEYLLLLQLKFRK